MAQTQAVWIQSIAVSIIMLFCLIKTTQACKWFVTNLWSQTLGFQYFLQSLSSLSYFLSLLLFNDYSKICSLSLNFLLNTFPHSLFVDDYGSYFLKKTETIGHHLSQFLLPDPTYYLQTNSYPETACLPHVQRENYPHFC